MVGFGGYHYSPKLTFKERRRMIPEERYICKYCIYCECNEQTEGTAICDVDIREQVDINHPSCYCFVYDDTFKRY